jgi:prepilin-type N-terminal cleavage/methylation domain-containing protein
MRATLQSRKGFTLMEVLMAVFILSGIILLMALPSSKFLSTTAKSQRRITASVAADAHIATVRMYPNYDSLRVKFDSTKTNTPLKGYTRQTRVIRSNPNANGDVTRVVVTITGPDLAAPIKRIATIAAP